MDYTTIVNVLSILIARSLLSQAIADILQNDKGNCPMNSIDVSD